MAASLAFSATVLALFAVRMGGGAAHAAESFACGPGGKPNAKTAVCDCPTGRVEKTTGGTSRCIDAAGGTKPPPTTTGTGTGTGTGTATPPVGPPTVLTSTCPAGQVLHSGRCVDLCAADEQWVAGQCLPRCPPDKTWTGSGCEKAKSLTLTCGEGKVPDATGHCCWPGQVWGDESGRCRGKPKCPAGYDVQGETCTFHCPKGMHRTGKGNSHCCWPGQEWSGAVASCVGVPSCPYDFEPFGDGCRHRPPKCEEGKVPADDDVHCCFPGQAWSPKVERCVGAPECPPLFVTMGEACVPAAKADEAAQVSARRERVTWLGVPYVEAGLGGEYSKNSVGWSMYALDYHVSGHLRDLPLMLRGALAIGGFSTGSSSSSSSTSTSSSSSSGKLLYAYRLGAMLAPLSLPNALNSDVSLLNPFAGFELIGTLFGSSSASYGNRGSLAGTLVFGNTILVTEPRATGKPGEFVRGGWTVSGTYGFSVFGNELRPDFRVQLTAGYVGLVL